MSTTSGKISVRFLSIILFADSCFIFLHILHTYSNVLPNPLFSITRGRGYGEVFQYIKEFWIAVLFFFLAIRHASLLFFSWSALFFYLLIENSFRFREQLGIIIANYLHLESKFGIQAKVFGELSGLIASGLLFLAFIGISHYLSDVDARKISKCLFFMVSLLAFFGIVVDILYPLVSSRALETVEDGSEMLIMSVIAWFAFSVNPDKKDIPGFCENI